MARRRQPPLFEVLSGLDRRPSSGEGNVLGRRPVEVQPDARADVRPSVAAPTRESPAPRASGFEDPSRSGPFAGFGPGSAPRAGHRSGPDERVVRVPIPALALGVAAIIVLLFILWPLAYSLGRKSAENELIPHAQSGEGQNIAGQGGELQADQGTPATNDASRLSKRPAPTGPTPVSADPPGTIQMAGRGGFGDAPTAMLPSSGSADPIRVPESALDRGSPAAAPSTPVQEDPRQIGFNYLELCTLTYKDALQAVGYLGKSGIRAAAVPARKGVDPVTAAAKNQPHLVFVADGFASDRFKASERDRRALETKVEQIGKKWQRDDRGPSDFSRPQWRLFKGKDKE